MDLVTNYEKLIVKGYEKIFFKPKLTNNAHFAFLFIFDDCNSIYTNNAHFKRSENFKFIVLGLIICVLVYYLKIYP